MENTNELIETHLKSRNYTQNEVCRIVNPKQQLLYLKNQIYPIDIYTSIDIKDINKSVIVMIFLKSETSEVYKKWCNYELD